MTNNKSVTLFLDIGGVLLTDGWGKASRIKAAEKFTLNFDETEKRHQERWKVFEAGKMTMDEYLRDVIFYTRRNFSKSDFISFMYDQSKPLNGSLEYFIQLKELNRIKVFALSNEVRELNEFRIKKFGLNDLFDAFISSCYVGLRKPDLQIFKMACDVSQTLPEQAIFVDDRTLNIEGARSFGIPSLQFDGLGSTKKYFQDAGLK